MARVSPIRSIACAALGAILAVLVGSSSTVSAQQAPAAPEAERQVEPRAQPRAEPQAEPDAPPKPPAVEPSEAPSGGAEQELVGLDVFSSDGTRVGQVRAVSTGASGDVVALLVRTGGFLGFGTRTVAISPGHFTRTGQSVRLTLDSSQVSGLPEVKE